MCVPLHLLCASNGGEAGLRHLSVLHTSNTASHSTHCWALRCHAACTLDLGAAGNTHCLCHDATAAALCSESKEVCWLTDENSGTTVKAMFVSEQVILAMLFR
jgi:hypothetical protein